MKIALNDMEKSKFMVDMLKKKYRRTTTTGNSIKNARKKYVNLVLS